MRVLVVGGTGLISTATVRELVARRDDVALFNRGETAAAPPGVHHLAGDRTHLPAFERRLTDAGPFDAVIDMVGFLPAEAESAVRAFRGRTAHYVFCSTVDVSTKPAARYPITEEAERRPSPAFPYALRKAECEAILWAAHARGDLPVTALRPAHIYGEGRGLVHSLASAN